MYSKHQITEAKNKLIDEFNKMLNADYGKIEINFNYISRVIKIISKPCYRINYKNKRKNEESP